MDEMSHINQSSTDMQYLEDLRQRINEKAERMISISKTTGKNSYRIIIILGIVLLVVLYAMIFQQHGDDGYLAGRYARAGVILLVTVLLSLLCIWILRHHLTVMKRSESPLLHYQAARRYINTSQLVGIILLTGLVAIIPTIYGENVRTVAFASCFIFVVLIIWRLFKPDLLINKGFYNDVEALGEHK